MEYTKDTKHKEQPKKENRQLKNKHMINKIYKYIKKENTKKVATKACQRPQGVYQGHQAQRAAKKRQHIPTPTLILTNQ